MHTIHTHVYMKSIGPGDNETALSDNDCKNVPFPFLDIILFQDVVATLSLWHRSL